MEQWWYALACDVPGSLAAWFSLVFAESGAPRTVVLNDDGGWCRLVKGRLIVGSIAGGVHDARRRCDVEVTSHDIKPAACRPSRPVGTIPGILYAKAYRSHRRITADAQSARSPAIKANEVP